MNTGLEELLAGVPVIPVLVVEDAGDAVRLAAALAVGGLPVIEVTLRTPAAQDAIAAIRAALPRVLVGAGTVLNPDDARRAADAGARFAVSPGYSRALGAACAERRLPLLPGAATASEVMALVNDGYALVKFFPAVAAGGVGMLRALAGPFPGVRFCPTGGVGARNAAAYLAEPNVACVGGSWVAPAEAVRRRDWETIEGLAREAAALRKSGP
ncbi:MAG TPA: bifunctional 4-hydroxy-2-oxoglutarate aldolase/2-dehydro-3-deoxy-phosphogluconate aldolase [Rhodocyclaceae bacterium]|nr:bifunctional 4-hydroxy-2-oxoglutarate aldolase/2-dehydro-3-deoxy-phosphogluconate aldolase [Rhodocyclaceae bacterium]